MDNNNNMENSEDIILRKTSERVDLFRNDILNMSIMAFCKAVGISRTTYYNALRTQHGCITILYALAEYASKHDRSLPMEWLMTGKPEDIVPEDLIAFWEAKMPAYYRNVSPNEETPPVFIPREEEYDSRIISREEWEMLHQFRNSSPRVKAKVLSTLFPDKKS